MEGAAVKKTKTIGVFSGDSVGKDEEFMMAANALGYELVERKIDLAHDRGFLGLTGCTSFIVCLGLRRVLVPDDVAIKNLIGENCQGNFRVAYKQKKILKMLECADAFIALPGDYSTLGDLFQILSWSEMNIHHKPIGVLNINGFFNRLLSFLNHARDQKFISQEAHELLISAPNAKELLGKMQPFLDKPNTSTSKLKQPAESSQVKEVAESSKSNEIDLTLRLGLP